MDPENPWRPREAQPAEAPGPSAPPPSADPFAAVAAQPHEPVPAAPRRRTGLVVALVLSILVAAGFAGAFAWQSLARANWEAQNDALRARVADLTITVSDKNARVAELEQAEAQLETLKEEYSAAVNTGARSTEVVTELEQIVDAYQQCVDAQQEHFDVLKNSERYVSSSIVSSERSIIEFCDQVGQSYADFRAENG